MQPLSPNDSKQIGPYRVMAELGRGAMGRVLLGAGPDGRLVAVKMIREWMVEDEEFRARFREEGRKSRQVSGQYTAVVVKAGPDDPIPWLATDFLRGPTLNRAIEASGPLPETAVLRLAAGLSSALDSIHEAGVIHRDLKPNNVILEANGPRVIDFGIARAAEGSDLTRTGAVIGTPGFMSPEQARSLPLTPASDIFSLGSVLVMACTGTGPFAAESTLDILNNVVRAEPDLTAMPGRIRTIAARCLAPDPADRPTPAELLELIGPVAPTSIPWPGAVAALAEEQHRELVRLLDRVGEDPTLIDNGSTMTTDPTSPPGARKSAAPGFKAPTPKPRVHTAARRRWSSSGRSEVQAGGGLVAFLVCIAVIAAAVWYATREDEQDPTDSHAEYVQECQDDGYTEADCEASWSNDPSYTWTGLLSGTAEETTLLRTVAVRGVHRGMPGGRLFRGRMRRFLGERSFVHLDRRALRNRGRLGRPVAVRGVHPGVPGGRVRPGGLRGVLAE